MLDNNGTRQFKIFEVLRPNRHFEDDLSCPNGFNKVSTTPPFTFRDKSRTKIYVTTIADSRFGHVDQNHSYHGLLTENERCQTAQLIALEFNILSCCTKSW